MPVFAPWQSILVNRETIFVIFPSLRGGYNLQVVPITEESFEMKQPFPESWLQENPIGCTFVHPNRFLAVFSTEETAIQAARFILP